MATNQPVAISNLVHQTTGVSISVTNTNDPVAMALKKLSDDEDKAGADVRKMVADNQALGTNARGQHPETGRAMIFRFFPVNPAKMTGNGSYSREFGWWDSPNSGDDPSVQIGIFGKSGNCVLLVGQRDAGETVSERHTGEVCYETLRPQRQWRLAKSLPAFLTMLRAK